ncbi:hypothetical protein H5410_050359 [Solanum commersonii]|uniref:Uncharacterized protein n=1 Tax=Solanum commersonii TaxID=4109 RepID=A0A9J5WXD9_SOLCO|nr:hypothetical protein H5410_050359 [Solanum commersonii]
MKPFQNKVKYKDKKDENGNQILSTMAYVKCSTDKRLGDEEREKMVVFLFTPKSMNIFPFV